MSRERKIVERSLQKKGFISRGGDHRFYFFEYRNLTTAVFTKVSRGTKYKTLNDTLIGEMARQLKLTKKQFLQLVDCPMDKKQYVEHLKQRNIIEV